MVASLACPLDEIMSQYTRLCRRAQLPKALKRQRHVRKARCGGASSMSTPHRTPPSCAIS